MKPSGFEGNAQWLAWPEQMALTDDLVQVRWPQALGERRQGVVAVVPARSALAAGVAVVAVVAGVAVVK